MYLLINPFQKQYFEYTQSKYHDRKKNPLNDTTETEPNYINLSSKIHENKKRQLDQNLLATFTIT